MMHAILGNSHPLLLFILVLGVSTHSWAKEDEAEAEQEAELRTVDEAIFEGALSDYYNQRYTQAAAGFWGYIKFGGNSAEHHEWSQYFLGESLRQLGLWHGAVQYYYVVAKTRSRPEILPEALSRLEEISRQRPFSEALILEDLIYDGDFGSLPPRLNDWVQYVQGLYDYRNDFVEWGLRHFSAIGKNSPHALRSRYVVAVYLLTKSRDDEAVPIFKEIIDSSKGDEDTKNKAKLALARLHFDNARYAEAQAIYDTVQQIALSFEQAQLLLEKAWTAYHLSEFRKAMGFLHALKAPSYERYFLPDAYMLRALILKELCHFIPAKRVVREFRNTYDRTLTALRRRIPMEKIRRIFESSVQDGSIARRTSFLATLEKERRLVDKHKSAWEDVGLDAHMRRLYDFEMREQLRRWRLEFEKSSENTALEMLEAEEQIALVDYEIGLDIFKRLKAVSGRRTQEVPLVIPYDSANVYYEFDTEFWNDELHSYEYFIQNRCFEVVGDGQ